jgi:hypothetical protein
LVVYVVLTLPFVVVISVWHSGAPKRKAAHGCNASREDASAKVAFIFSERVTGGEWSAGIDVQTRVRCIDTYREYLTRLGPEGNHLDFGSAEEAVC